MQWGLHHYSLKEITNRMKMEWKREKKGKYMQNVSSLWRAVEKKKQKKRSIANQKFPQTC